MGRHGIFHLITEGWVRSRKHGGKEETNIRGFLKNMARERKEKGKIRAQGRKN